MKAWRLCRRPFADLAGDGARVHGGRWNSPGRAMVYAASTAALALLEVRAHLDLPFELLPADYVLMEVNFGDLAVEAVDSIPADPAGFGDAWLCGRRTPVLQVPSFIIPESTNLLLNPAHPQAGAATVTGIRDFAFDPRLWRP